MYPGKFELRIRTAICVLACLVALAHFACVRAAFFDLASQALKKNSVQIGPPPEGLLF